MTHMVRTEKINLLRRLKDHDEEVEQLFDVVCLYYPMLLDNPETATTAMINGYNRLVKTNISDINTQKSLII